MMSCPGCSAALVNPPWCGVCGLALTGPEAVELWAVDQEIGRLHARRRMLLNALYARSARPTPAEPPAGPPAELPRPGVRDLLLGLGGATLGLAVLVFTLISWGSLGPLGRGAVLLALAGAALGGVWPLERRGLRATAETVALIGLVPVASLAYVMWLRWPGGVDGAWYAVGATAVLTVLWAAYGTVAPLRSAAPTAVLLAQAPVLLTAVALDVPVVGTSLLLVGLALADLALRAALAGAAHAGARRVATVAGAVALTAGALWASPTWWLLPVAAGAALVWGLLVDGRFGLVAGLALAGTAPVAASGPGLGADSSETSLICVAAGLLTAVAALQVRRRDDRPAEEVGPGLLGRAVAAGGLVVAVAGLVAHLPLLVEALVIPMVPSVVGPVWTAPVAFALAALVAGAAAFGEPRTARVAVPFAAAAVVTVPSTWTPPVAAVAALVFGLLAAGIAASRPVAGAVAVPVGVWAAAASLESPAMTTAVLALLLVGAGAVAAAPLAGRDAVRDPAVSLGVLAAGSLAAQVALRGGLPVEHAAFAVLAVAAVSVPLVTRLGGVPGEAAVAVLAAVAVAMTAGPSGWTAWPTVAALAGAALVAFGFALRPDRRRAGIAGAALLTLAWWTLLRDAGIDVVEAYTAPVTAGLLVHGLVLRSRPDAPRSWSAYGPGLAFTLLPSLAVAQAETGALRPALLAVACAALVLVGARFRLQAPLLLGGAVLLLDGVRHLGPELAVRIAILPTWVPIALVGTVLVLVGATYERRLRNLRTLHGKVTAMG